MRSQALTVHCRAATTASNSPTSRVVARHQSSQNQRFTWFSAPRLVAFTPNLGAGSRVLRKPAECPRILIRVQPPDLARELHGRGVSLQHTDDRSGFRLGAMITASRCPLHASACLLRRMQHIFSLSYSMQMSLGRSRHERERRANRHHFMHQECGLAIVAATRNPREPRGSNGPVPPNAHLAMTCLHMSTCTWQITDL